MCDVFSRTNLLWSLYGLTAAPLYLSRHIADACRMCQTSNDTRHASGFTTVVWYVGG